MSVRNEGALYILLLYSLGKIDIKGHKIQFEDIKETDKEQQIQFSGVPFIILGARYFDCSQGVDRNIAKKISRFTKKDEQRKQVCVTCYSEEDSLVNIPCHGCKN